MLIKALHFIFIIFLTTCAFSQKKGTCSVKVKEDTADLNSISISKCPIGKPSLKKNLPPTLRVSYRKIRNIKPKITAPLKKNEKTALNIQGENINESSVKEVSPETLNLKTQKNYNEILFSVVDEIPLFPKCRTEKSDTKLKCFNQGIAKHFSKNFHPEESTTKTVKQKFLIRFTIKLNGEVERVMIKSKKQYKAIEKEIRRVLNKLPTFSPGVHNGSPVRVKYSIPINIDIN